MLYNFNNFIMLFFVKKGVCFILNVNEVYRVRNELKVILVCKEEICNWGYFIINENKDFIRLLYLFLKLYGMLGSICMMMMIYIIIILVVIKKMNCYFKYLLIILFIMCEVRIFVSNFDIIIFIFFFLVLGVENWVVMGIKICGIIE